MAHDLFLGPRRRWWSRDPDLTTYPLVPAAPETPAQALARRVREVDERVKFKKVDGGAVVAAKIRW